MSESPPPSFWKLLRSTFSGEGYDYAKGSLRIAVPLLAVPMVLEMAMEALFAICDVFFLAMVGPTAVATVGFAESLLALIYALAFGIAMPATALVARRIGEGDSKAASRAGAQAIWFGLAVGLVTGLSALAAPHLLVLMGAETAVVRQGTAFTIIALASSPTVVLLFVNSAVLRGAGEATTAMKSLWLANGLNIFLDPCLIFGWGPFPELGVTGAAVATTIGRSVGVLYQLYYLYRGRTVSLRGNLAIDIPVLKTIARLSIAGTMQHLVETGSWVALTRIMASFGSAAVAGYTIAIRVAMFTLMPAWGLSNATATLVGQSLGAGDPRRAERAVWISGLYTTVFLGLVALALLLFPDLIASFFSDEPATADVASAGMFFVAFGYVFYAWQMVCQQAFNGAGDTTTPAVINFVCFWLIQIPLAWLLANTLGFGPDGIFITIATCYSIAAAISVVLVRRGRWKRVVV